MAVLAHLSKVKGCVALSLLPPESAAHGFETPQLRREYIGTAHLDTIEAKYLAKRSIFG
jgi:hypothetical protein